MSQPYTRRAQTDGLADTSEQRRQDKLRRESALVAAARKDPMPAVILAERFGVTPTQARILCAEVGLKLPSLRQWREWA